MFAMLLQRQQQFTAAMLQHQQQFAALTQQFQQQILALASLHDLQPVVHGHASTARQRGVNNQLSSSTPSLPAISAASLSSRVLRNNMATKLPGSMGVWSGRCSVQTELLKSRDREMAGLRV